MVNKDDKKVVENKKETVKKASKPKPKSEPKLLSVTWNQCRRNSYRSILIDEDNKCFICSDEIRGQKANRNVYPFGKDKKGVLQTILAHGEFYCFSVHKVFPKKGEFAELYK